jgi:hypothetical protein
MPRVSVNPGRDPDTPLVDILPDASPGMKVLLLGLRWYLVAIFALGLLGLAVWVLLILML